MSTLNQIKVEDTLYDIEDKEARNGLTKKVDKAEGKGLSTNDFTNEDKEKLDSLSNSDDELFRVNMTLNGTEYVPDKTYVEVIQAYDEGKMIQCEIELDGVKMVLPLCNINKTEFYVIYGGAAETMTLAVLHAGNDYIQVIPRMLATEDYVNNAIANIDIPEGGETGGGNGLELLINFTTEEEVQLIDIPLADFYNRINNAEEIVVEIRAKKPVADEGTKYGTIIAAIYDNFGRWNRYLLYNDSISPSNGISWGKDGYGLSVVTKGEYIYVGSQISYADNVSSAKVTSLGNLITALRNTDSFKVQSELPMGVGTNIRFSIREGGHYENI